MSSSPQPGAPTPARELNAGEVVGRTTRMLQNALARARGGAIVFVVAARAKHAAELRRRIDWLGGASAGIQVVSASAEWLPSTMRGYGAASVFWDHFALEVAAGRLELEIEATLERLALAKQRLAELRAISTAETLPAPPEAP